MKLSFITLRSLARFGWVALLAAGLTVPLAADSVWEEALGGNFGDGANWDTTDAPGTTDSATFNLNETYTVTFDDDYTNTAATIANGSVTFNLDVNTYTTTASTNAFVVQGASGQSASLLISGDGTLLTGDTTTAITSRIGTVGNGSGAVTVDGATWDNSGQMEIGASNATGSLTIENGGSVINREGQVSLAANAAAASLLVTGTGSSLNIADNRLNAGTGATILVEAGGSLTGATSQQHQIITSLMTVTGEDSSLHLGTGGVFWVTGSTFNLLDQATATTPVLRIRNTEVNISGGATYSGSFEVNYNNGGSGVVNVSGANTHAGGSVRLYGDPDGVRESIVTVSDGASFSGLDLFGGNWSNGVGSRFVATGTGTEVTFTTTQLGWLAGSEATMEVADGATVNPGNLIVGSVSGSNPGGTGFLEVDDATVEAFRLRIGLVSTSTGTVTITNGGSVKAEPDAAVPVTIGQSGTGTLTIASGGSFSHLGNSFIGANAGSTGTATVDGASSSWNVGSTNPLVSGTNTLSVGVDGTGTLILANGGTVTAGNIIIGENGTLSGDGFAAALVTNSGLVSPGNSTGILYTTGGFTQTATGILEIGIGGLTAGTEFDQISNFILDSDATLAGTLNLLSVNSFMPSLDDEFLILDFTATGGSIIGEFDTINAFSLDSGLAWNFDNLYIDGTVSVIPEPATVAFLLGALALGAAFWRRKRA